MKDAEIVIKILAGKVVKISVTTQEPNTSTYSQHLPESDAGTNLTVQIQGFDLGERLTIKENNKPAPETEMDSGAEWPRYADLFPEAFASEDSDFSRPAEVARSPEE